MQAIESHKWSDYRDQVKNVSLGNLEGLVNDLYGSPGKRHGKEMRLLCPFHDDHDPSLDLVFEGDRKGVFFCRSCGAKGDIINLVQKVKGFGSKKETFDWIADRYHIQRHSPRKLNIPYRNNKPEKSTIAPLEGEWWKRNQPPTQRNQTGRWFYTSQDDSDRCLIVNRIESDEGKTFVQWSRNPDTGKYEIGAKHAPKPVPPYDLQTIIDNPTDPVLIVEGEKCVDEFLEFDKENDGKTGMVVTTSAGGAKAYHKTDWTPLKGRAVCIWPDADKAGKEYSRAVAEILNRLPGTEIRIIEPVMPDGSPMPDKGDVVDWIADGGNLKQFNSLCDQADKFEIDGALTDIWNAKLFAQMYKGTALYCHIVKKWYVYDGQRWKPDDTGEIVRKAKKTTKKIFEIASQQKTDESREKYSKHAIKSQNKTRIDAMIQLAQSELPVTLKQFDKDIFLFNVENGTLDLRTGRLQPHSPNDFISKLAPVKYDSDAKAPLWIKFLDIIFSGNQKLIQYIQTAIGYSLTGDVRHDCLFIFYGEGCNGKTTFLVTIQQMMGDYARQMPPYLLIQQKHRSHPTELMELKGTRFMPGSEVEKDSVFDEVLVKKLTGGDHIKGRGMYQDFVEFEPTQKFFIAVNHLPRIYGNDEGIWRRIKVIPFDVRITDVDEGYRMKLQDELSGILNWVLEGAVAWYNGDGKNPTLKEPLDVIEATEKYRGHVDILSLFILGRCEQGPQSCVSSSEIYQAYLAWCSEYNYKSISQTAFGRALSMRGFGKKKTTGKTIRTGIALKQTENEIN